MAHIKMEIYLYAEDKILSNEIDSALADEELKRQFAVDAAIGLRDAVAEYVRASRHVIDYDVEVLEF